MMNACSQIRQCKNRDGVSLVIIVLLLGLVFVAVAFSVDVARIQLTQLELQSAADVAARAGAEAMARGVGGNRTNAQIEEAIRDEIEGIAKLNTVGGLASQTKEIVFGQIDNAGGNPRFAPNADGKVSIDTRGVRVNVAYDEFPIVFGSFVGKKNVNASQRATAMVQTRDIVVVLDKSTSMMSHDAGDLPESSYLRNLYVLQDEMFGPDDKFHYPSGENGTKFRNTEFDLRGGDLRLSRSQALRLAVLKFRNVIDESPDNEQLGLVTYGAHADSPEEAPVAPGIVDIEAGLSSEVFDSIVGSGSTVALTEKNASALEDSSGEYDNFDYNYLRMRWLGGTNIVDGINKGVQVLFGPGRRSLASPVLIVLTDGIHNRDGNPEDTAREVLAAHPNLQIYTISFGKGANQESMKTIAGIGSGLHYYATDVLELVDAFEELARSAGVTLIE